MLASNQAIQQGYRCHASVLRQPIVADVSPQAACHMLVVRTSQRGRSAFSTMDPLMSTHSLKSGSEIAGQSRAAHHIPFRRVGYDARMPNSATTAASNGARVARSSFARGGATHTDPQILFSVVAS